MAEPSGHSTSCPRCAVLERRVAELEARVGELEQLLLEATRAAKRQVTPFSRHKPKAKPKTPGRPKGHTPAQRPAPTAGQISETIRVSLDRCPSCGGRLTDRQTHEQVLTDLPEVQPVTRKYITHSDHCRRCGRVRDRIGGCQKL